MPILYGALNIEEAAADRTYVQTVGQRVVYDAVQQVINQHNADLQAAMGVFIESTTSDFKRRYKLPGSGYMQRRGGSAKSAAVKAGGSWDVAFPLEDFGDQFAQNDIALAYMTVAELNRHLQTITAQDINTVRLEMLKSLFNNTQWSFVDPIQGTLTVEPLANGDAVVYPPVLGSDSEATETHYLESGYAESGISDTNNPFVTIKDELEEHFGSPAGGSNVVVFVNNSATAKVEALTEFDPVNDRFTLPGANTDTLTGLPANLPGKLLGRCNGVWVAEWRWIPANYAFGIHLDAPKPLIQRVDPEDTNLGTGLQMVARDPDYPFEGMHYRHRFGFGVGNRLNGVVLEFGTGGSYTVPSAYTR